MHSYIFSIELEWMQVPSALGRRVLLIWLCFLHWSPDSSDKPIDGGKAVAFFHCCFSGTDTQRYAAFEIQVPYSPHDKLDHVA